MKLTKQIKDRIVANILDDTFGARETALKEEKVALADDIYFNYYTPYKTTMSKLPAAFFYSSSSFSIKIGGYGRTVHMSTSRLFSAQHTYGSVHLDDKGVFEARYVELMKKSDALIKDKDGLERTLRSVIEPVTTDKKLVEVWPEVNKWIPTTTAAIINLAAVKCDDLNDLLLKLKGGTP